MTMKPTQQRSWAAGKMLSEIHDRIGIVTFNSPEKLNAVSIEMWEGLGQIIEAYERDDEVRVIVLKGAGEKAFVSGGDISQFAESRANADVHKQTVARIDAGRNAVINCRKPTIACVRGYCLGGGLAIALQADLRIASTDSRFGIPAARLGIVYGYEGLRTLVSLVGPAHARMMMYSADRMSAAEAERIGLVRYHVATATTDMSFSDDWQVIL